MLAKTYQGHACADDMNGDPADRADRFFEADLRHDNDEYVSEAHGWVGDREIEVSERLKVQEDRNSEATKTGENRKVSSQCGEILESKVRSP